MQGADAVINESEINRRKKIAKKGRRYKDIIQQHENKFKIADKSRTSEMKLMFENYF